MRCRIQISFLIPVIILLAVVISIPGSVRSDDFYVDAIRGNDETGDGSQSSPWRKLQFAIDTIEGTLENPHTIHLAPGFYGPKGSGDEKYMYADSYESIHGASPHTTLINILQAKDLSDIVISHIQGLIAVKRSSNVVTEFCIIINSTSGGFSSDSDTLLLNSIVYNSRYSIYSYGGLTQAINCIFFNNVEGVRIFGEYAQVEITYSILEEDYPGEGNIVADPLFSDPENGDFRIGYGSPCIDAGDPDSPVPPGGGDRIDMGCREYLVEPQLLPVAMETTEITGDGDGIPEYGEILESRMEIMNTGEPALSVTAVLACSHPDVTLLTGGISYPDMAPWETANPSGDGFRWQVTGESGGCCSADFTVTWIASGATGTIPVVINLHSDGPHVDPVSGSDLTGSGTPEMPYKTITHALNSARGSRWSPLTVYAHAGTYSPSTNGENYPIWFGDWESLEGDNWNVILECHDDEIQELLLPGLGSDIISIHARTESTDMLLLIRCNFTNSTFENCFLERMDTTVRDGALNIMGSGSYTVSNCLIIGSSLNGDAFRSNHLIQNNMIYGTQYLSVGQFINNWVNDLDQAYYSDLNDPMLISGNVIELGRARTEPGRFEFSDNIVLLGSRGFAGEPGNRIVRNIALDGSFGLHGTGVTTSHNITLSTRYAAGGYSGSGVYIDNSIAASLKPSLQQWAYYITLGGSFALDNCIGAFGVTGVFWAGTSWSNHGIYYHNLYGEYECHDAWYNDVRDCPGETNMVLDPEFVGTGIITALGPGYLEDSTAAWEPDRYAGYYVNPDAPNQDTQFYITGNDADTLYVMGNPGVAASVGDRFFFPDFHLRRIADGYAWDSPLIDAGNPDPMYNDPDGSRCDLGPYGGPLATTPMPVIPTWPPPDTPTVTPTPSPTPTATPTMTPTVTATAEPTGTPVCDITGVTIEMPLEMYYPGDTCYVTVTVCNTTGSPLVDYPLFVILDVYGTFFFGPGFTGEFDSYLRDYPVFPRDATVVPVLDPFTWPDTGTSAAGILFHAALTDPDVALIFGEMDTFEFGWARGGQ